MTIKDIARECGCAVGTVSRVLNNHPDVSDKTREKVMAVVERYGFVVNANAKQLKSQERKNLAIIVKGTSSTLLNGLLERIQRKLESLSYSADVIVLDENDNEGISATKVYFSLKPLGIIFLGGSPDRLGGEFGKVHVPSILISSSASSLESGYVSSLSTDNLKAAYSSAKYLLKNGHTKIAVIGGTLDSELSRVRYDGFMKALKGAKVPFDFDSSYEVSKYSFEGGFSAAESLMKKNPGITAIFTMSDAMAIGAIRKLRDMGMKVPEDISVIGFDGISLGEYMIPRLTTIRQMEDRLADEGLEILLDCIENKSSPSHRLIPFELVEGESVADITA